MAQSKSDIALISASELSLVEDNTLNPYQLKLLLKKTPPQYVHKRPAKGGGEWEYVSGGYIRKMLNLMFGWDWDFEVVTEQVLFNTVVIKGKLTCRANGKSITKTQFGTKEIIFKRDTKDALNIGNDFKEVNVDTQANATFEELKELYDRLDKYEAEKNVDLLTDDERAYAIRVIRDKEERTYNVIRKLLTEKLQGI